VSRRAVLKVAINAPLPGAFDYLPPPHADVPLPGTRVRVPFGRRREIGLVLEVTDGSDLPRSKLKRVASVLDQQPILGEDELWLIGFTSDYYHHPVGEVVAAALPALLRQGRPFEATVEFIDLTAAWDADSLHALARRAPRQAEVISHLQSTGSCTKDALDLAFPNWRRVRKPLLDNGHIRIEERLAEPAPNERREAADGPTLNREQQAALEQLRANDGFCTYLLDGVTGSGKTEVYLQVMRDLDAAGKQTLILVPEIGLTPQFVERLEQRLGSRPALLHSGLTDSERLHAWRRAAEGSASVVLGTRSAVFTPLKNPGLIVVDEEHDMSFKQQEGLRYSARDLAVARAKRLQIPVVLGSATPSLDSLQHIAADSYKHLTLSQRAGGAMPPHLRLIDTNRHPGAEGLSPPLVSAIDAHIERGGQALIFLNRRGFAPTLICGACSHIADCQRCDSRLTVHLRDRTLVCHHCGGIQPLNDTCAACGAQTVPLGEGTERIEEALARRFPQHRVTRIDSDSTRLKGTMDRALSMAVSGEARILVGTQMLSKGHHFPQLTLVGVVNADQGLFSTDFRGGERLAQSLTQVAGRAGRERQQGEVLIQTAFPQHAFWGEWLNGGYHQVARFGLAEREAAGWPPYSRLALIRASGHQRDDPMRFLNRAAELAREARAADVRILGPVSAPMERRAGRYRGQLLLQSVRRGALHAVLQQLRNTLHAEPAARRVRWSMDVDPLELF